MRNNKTLQRKRPSLNLSAILSMLTCPETPDIGNEALTFYK